MSFRFTHDCAAGAKIESVRALGGRSRGGRDEVDPDDRSAPTSSEKTTRAGDRVDRDDVAADDENDRNSGVFVLWLDEIQDRGAGPVRGEVERISDSKRLRFRSFRELLRILRGNLGG